jgi:hypothetical protein
MVRGARGSAGSGLRAVGGSGVDVDRQRDAANCVMGVQTVYVCRRSVPKRREKAQSETVGRGKFYHVESEN